MIQVRKSPKGGYTCLVEGERFRSPDHGELIRDLAARFPNHGVRWRDGGDKVSFSCLRGLVDLWDGADHHGVPFDLTWGEAPMFERLGIIYCQHVIDAKLAGEGWIESMLITANRSLLRVLRTWQDEETGIPFRTPWSAPQRHVDAFRDYLADPTDAKQVMLLLAL